MPREGKGKNALPYLEERRKEKSLFFYKSFLLCSVGIVTVIWFVSPASSAGVAGAAPVRGAGRSAGQRGGEKQVKHRAGTGPRAPGEPTEPAAPCPREAPGQARGHREQGVRGLCAVVGTRRKRLCVAAGGWLLRVVLAVGGRNRRELSCRWSWWTAQVCWGKEGGEKPRGKSCSF